MSGVQDGPLAQLNGLFHGQVKPIMAAEEQKKNDLKSIVVGVTTLSGITRKSMNTELNDKTYLSNTP